MGISMISLAMICIPLFGFLFLGTGAVIYWKEPDNKILAGVFVGIGILIFICTLASVALLFLNIAP